MLNIQVMIVQHLFFSQLLFEMRTMLYAIVKALHLYVLHRLQKRLKTAVLSFLEKPSSVKSSLFTGGSDLWNSV